MSTGSKPAAPTGTRVWRKGWRKRWREGSSFRRLSSLAQRIVIWVEDNADDEGTVHTTTRYLAQVMSCYREPVSRMAVWRAVQSAVKVGIFAIPGVTAGVTPGVTAEMVITRCNFKEYQERPEPAVTPAVTLDESQAGLSSRGKQKKAEETKTTPDEPAFPEGTDWKGLIEAMTKAWATRYGGAKLVFLGKDWKPLKALVCSLTDVEVWRRWEIYLANEDRFYTGHPVSLFCSQVNRFVVPPAPERSFREPWEGESPKGPSEWRETQ